MVALEALHIVWTSIRPDVLPDLLKILGQGLVLAGGVYRPLPFVRQNGAANLNTIPEHPGVSEPCGVHKHNGAITLAPERAMIDLTPREQHVLEALQLGLPNKLIAVRLKLSENTVKMHIQRIMRKCSARNRTEALEGCDSSDRECPRAIAQSSPTGENY